MELTQLKFFLKVASLEHMSKAAEELNISQPALSANIRKLEAELGVELFTRRGRHIELNDYGAYLYGQLAPLVERLEETFDALREMRYAEFKEIVIDADPIYTFPGLLNKMSAVVNQTSGITLRNVHNPVNEIFAKILANEIDFSVMGIEMDDPRMEKLLLSRDELVMLVHSGHPLAGTGSAPLKSFAGEEFAVKERAGVPASYDLTSERYCKRAGFRPNIAFKSPSRRELVDVVRSRHYVMFTPINAISQYRLDGLSIVHVSDIDCYACLWMYWKKGKKERTPARLLREFVIDFFQNRDQISSSNGS